VKQVTEHAKALVALEIELAKLEVKDKVSALGTGMGLLVAAAIGGLFALGFLLATLAAVLALAVDTWIAILTVAVLLVAVTFILTVVGVGKLRRGAPPVPEQAIREARLTTEALKANDDRHP
jgi:amino acid transporter